MDSRVTRRAQAFAAGALLFALALVLVPTLRHNSARQDDGIDESSPGPSRIIDPSREAPPAAIPERTTGVPGFARPLDAQDVPAPGAARRPSKSAATSAAGYASASAATFPRAPVAGYASPSFPSGGSAPSAATGGPALVQSSAEAETRTGTDAPPATKRAPRSKDSGGHPPGQEDGFGSDGRLGAATSGFLAEARRQKDAAANNPLAPGSIGSLLMRGVEQQHAIDAQLRDAIEGMQRSGTATPEAMQKAAEGIIAAHNGGGPVDPEDALQAVGRATGPKPPAVPPGAYADAVRDLSSAPPLTPQQLADLKRENDDPPPKRGPAPKNALQAFQQNVDVFKKAQAEYGVPPEIILGILGVESDYGRGDMGKKPAKPTLDGLMIQYAGTSKARQAQADSVALVNLKAQDQLGQGTPTVNYAGAMGAPQFLFSSWEAYGRGVGPKRDPYSLPDSILSVANYLHIHGYSKDVGRSILAYNHSTEYEQKVLATAASVKPMIEKANASADTPAATARP